MDCEFTTPSICKTYLFLSMANEVWEVVKEMYFDGENSSQIFEIKTQLWQTKQGERKVKIYYLEMINPWQELNLDLKEECDCFTDNIRNKKRVENERVFKFLAIEETGLDLLLMKQMEKEWKIRKWAK